MANMMVVAEDFSDVELDVIEEAALAQNMAPADWIRKVVLAVAHDVTADDSDDKPDDEDMALEVTQKSQDEREDEEGPIVIAGGVDAAILERLDRLEATLQEVCVWAQTVLSELYAHTGFASEAAEKEARAKAVAKFQAIKASVEVMMKRSNGTAH